MDGQLPIFGNLDFKIISLQQGADKLGSDEKEWNEFATDTGCGSCMRAASINQFIFITYGEDLVIYDWKVECGTVQWTVRYGGVCESTFEKA